MAKYFLLDGQEVYDEGKQVEDIEVLSGVETINKLKSALMELRPRDYFFAERIPLKRMSDGSYRQE